MSIHWRRSSESLTICPISIKYLFEDSVSVILHFRLLFFSNLSNFFSMLHVSLHNSKPAFILRWKRENRKEIITFIRRRILVLIFFKTIGGNLESQGCYTWMQVLHLENLHPPTVRVCILHCVWRRNISFTSWYSRYLNILGIRENYIQDKGRGR